MPDRTSTPTHATGSVRRVPRFGHTAYSGAGVHIDFWGAGPILMRSGKRRWWFEFSERFGPTILRPEDMEPSDHQPTREDHPFWRGFTPWMKAGRRCRAVLDKNGRVKFWIAYVPRRAVNW